MSETSAMIGFAKAQVAEKGKLIKIRVGTETRYSRAVTRTGRILSFDKTTGRAKVAILGYNPNEWTQLSIGNRQNTTVINPSTTSPYYLEVSTKFENPEVNNDPIAQLNTNIVLYSNWDTNFLNALSSMAPTVHIIDSIIESDIRTQVKSVFDTYTLFKVTQDDGTGGVRIVGTTNNKQVTYAASTVRPILIDDLIEYFGKTTVTATEILNNFNYKTNYAYMGSNPSVNQNGTYHGGFEITKSSSATNIKPSSLPSPYVIDINLGQYREWETIPE